MYKHELRIEAVPDRVVGRMRAIGYNCECEVVISPNRDRITFSSDHSYAFTGLSYGLQRVCELYDIDYISLLI